MNSLKYQRTNDDQKLKNFLPYGRQTITEADIAEVVEVLHANPYLTQGPAIQAFEQKVASKVGAKHGVACNRATSALPPWVHGFRTRRRGYLWTTPITFVASANCGRYCGANIDFVDIDPKTGLMSIPKLAKKLEEAELKGKLPKIVVPVHLCGTSCEMATINKLSKQYGFAILEDTATPLEDRMEINRLEVAHIAQFVYLVFTRLKL